MTIWQEENRRKFWSEENIPLSWRKQTFIEDFGEEREEDEEEWVGREPHEEDDEDWKSLCEVKESPLSQESIPGESQTWHQNYSRFLNNKICLNLNLDWEIRKAVTLQ